MRPANKEVKEFLLVTFGVACFTLALTLLIVNIVFRNAETEEPVLQQTAVEEVIAKEETETVPEHLDDVEIFFLDNGRFATVVTEYPDVLAFKCDELIGNGYEFKTMPQAVGKSYGKYTITDILWYVTLERSNSTI